MHVFIYKLYNKIDGQNDIKIGWNLENIFLKKKTRRHNYDEEGKHVLIYIYACTSMNKTDNELYINFERAKWKKRGLKDVFCFG